jgi:hypothetical protein
MSERVCGWLNENTMVGGRWSEMDRDWRIAIIVHH